MLEELNLSNNNNTVKARIINDLIRGLIVILSSILYSLSVVILLEPAHVISVGLSATSQILSKTLLLINPNIPSFFTSIGLYVLIFNIPLLIIGFKNVSHRFIAFTIISILVQSITMFGFFNGEEMLTNMVPDVELASMGTRLFLTILAGLFCGFSIGVALRYGTSTGGVDIISQVVNFKYGYSTGVVQLIINIILAIINGLIEHDIRATFLTFIFIIICSITIDKIHTAYNFLRIDIVTTKKEEVISSLLKEVNRGCTVLNVEGGFTKEMKSDVFMIISSYELYRTRRAIKEVDNNAFIIISPVKRIIGAFFKRTIV